MTVNLLHMHNIIKIQSMGNFRPYFLILEKIVMGREGGFSINLQSIIISSLKSSNGKAENVINLSDVPNKLNNMTWSFLTNLLCSSSERTSKTRRLCWHPKVVFNKEIIYKQIRIKLRQCKNAYKL